MEKILKIEAIRKLIIESKYEVKYLNQENVLEWIYNEKSFTKSLTNDLEKDFGARVIGYKTNQRRLNQRILQQDVRRPHCTQVPHPLRSDTFLRHNMFH